jgi:TolB-like protein
MVEHSPMGGSVRVSLNSGQLVNLGILCLCLACGGKQPATVSPERSKAEKAARRAVAEERSLGTEKIEPRSLGILPFEVSPPDTALVALSYGLADLLTTDLARSKKLQVVDRVQLNAVLREIGLVESGRVDSSSAPRVGKLIQARRLVLGSLGWTPKGELGLNIHIADVPSGNVRTAVSARTSIDDILRAEKQLALELFDKLGVGLTPKEQAAVEQMPTKNVDAFLAYSRGVRFEAEGRYTAAAKEYQQAAALDPDFKAAAVQLEAVQSAAAAPAPTQQANAGVSQARATGVVADRVNPDPVSPIGGQQISSPFEGGSDLPVPLTTIIITVTVPQ